MPKLLPLLTSKSKKIALQNLTILDAVLREDEAFFDALPVKTLFLNIQSQDHSFFETEEFKELLKGHVSKNN